MSKPKDQQIALPFNGPTRTIALDGKRLAKQLGTVLNVMQEAASMKVWLTFGEIATIGELRPTQAASISARLRELRDRGWTVDKRRRGDPKDGLWEYYLSDEPGQTEAA